MNRRAFIHTAILANLLCIAGGCKARLKQFDRQPNRALLADRWSGYYFDTVQASYLLQLTAPNMSLNRANRQFSIVSNNQESIGRVAAIPGVSPTRADVKLNYMSGAPTESDIQVTVHWPVERPQFDSTRSTSEETMSALVESLIGLRSRDITFLLYPMIFRLRLT